VSVAQIQELNPQILRGVTPPKDWLFVRLPEGSAEGFAAALADLPKSARVGLFTVTTKKNETMESVAKREGIPARQLAAFNPNAKRLRSGRLTVGQTLLVPTPAVAGAAVSVPDPSIERYGSSASSKSSMYVVKSGETLSGIAKKHGTTVSALMAANSLRRPVIFAGQSLVVRGPAKKASAAKQSVAKKSGAPAKKAVAAQSKKSSKKRA
jgi:LysM repeat protein